MKTYKNLYEPMLQREAIRECFYLAARHKTTRKDVSKVLCDIDHHVERLHGILEREEFFPSYHIPKIIKEASCKKERRIVKPNYKYEQVVGHCVIMQFKKVVLDGFYEFSCGSIPGRGCHGASKWVSKWIKKYNGKKFYVLKMDIRRFFDSIDRPILKKMLCEKIRDDRFLRLMYVLIEYDKIAEIFHLLDENHVRIDMDQRKNLTSAIAYDRAAEADNLVRQIVESEQLRTVLIEIIHSNRTGVPLGYYTSQWFGNFILKKMDHWIKQDLQAAHYVRYMDDMVIFGRNKKKLSQMRQQIDEYLQQELHLRLKDNWQIFRFEYSVGHMDDHGKAITRGRMLDFLGFQFHFNRKTLRKSTLCTARRKARRIRQKQVSSKVSWYEASQMLSYMGSIDAADVYDYYLEYIKPYIIPKKLKKIVSNHTRRLNRYGNYMGRTGRHPGIQT